MAKKSVRDSTPVESRAAVALEEIADNLEALRAESTAISARATRSVAIHREQALKRTSNPAAAGRAGREPLPEDAPYRITVAPHALHFVSPFGTRRRHFGHWRPITRGITFTRATTITTKRTKAPTIESALSSGMTYLYI